MVAVLELIVVVNPILINGIVITAIFHFVISSALILLFTTFRQISLPLLRFQIWVTLENIFSGRPGPSLRRLVYLTVKQLVFNGC